MHMEWCHIIEEALEHYYIPVPDNTRQIIIRYFGGIQLRFTIDSYTIALLK